MGFEIDICAARFRVAHVCTGSMRIWLVPAYVSFSPGYGHARRSLKAEARQEARLRASIADYAYPFLSRGLSAARTSSACGATEAVTGGHDGACEAAFLIERRDVRPFR